MRTMGLQAVDEQQLPSLNMNVGNCMKSKHHSIQQIYTSKSIATKNEHLALVVAEHIPELRGKKYEYAALSSNDFRDFISVMISRNNSMYYPSLSYFGSKITNYLEKYPDRANWRFHAVSPLEYSVMTHHTAVKKYRNPDYPQLLYKAINNGVIEINNGNDDNKIWCIFSTFFSNEGNDTNYHWLVHEKCNEAFCTNVIKGFFDFQSHPFQGVSGYIEVVNNGNYVILDPTSVNQPLVVSGETQRDLLDDFNFFLTKRNWFEKNDIPYKRGYLLVGPPGNGKTSLIRKLVVTPGFKSYSFDFKNENANNRSLIHAFNRARENAPSFFIMEDVDRAFDKQEENSSNCISKDTLFNCLDGLQSNAGVVVIATANFPELLDIALLKRPGRFDRVIRIGRPDGKMRNEMLQALFGKNPDNALCDDVYDALVAESVGFSMAAVKEIYIAAAGFAHLELRENITDQDALAAVQQVKRQFLDKSDSQCVGFGKS